MQVSFHLTKTNDMKFQRSNDPVNNIVIDFEFCCEGRKSKYSMLQKNVCELLTVHQFMSAILIHVGN